MEKRYFTIAILFALYLVFLFLCKIEKRKNSGTTTIQDGGGFELEVPKQKSANEYLFCLLAKLFASLLAMLLVITALGW